MNLELAERIAKAVLYEGYVLYPYTPSSLKNQQRWTFGGIYPQAYALAQGSADPCWMQTEVLIQAGPAAQLDCRVRFLHLQDRSVAEADGSPTGEVDGMGLRPVESLQVGSRYYVSWQEAVERETSANGIPLQALLEGPRRLEITFPDMWRTEILRDPATSELAGAIIRCQHAIAGTVELSAVPCGQAGQDLVKVSVRITNTTPLDSEAALTLSREDALMDSFISTHTLLAVRGGQFISLLESPPAFQPLISACKNVGAWPVLVGAAGERDLMLSSPIILYDYPEIAPESPGDLFDGTEIDEILTLRILTLTDEEKTEIRQTDERGRELLDRTEALSPDQLRALHGTIRSLRPIGRNLYDGLG